jgi:hypothetical protein
MGSRPTEIDPYLPFTTKPGPLVLTKGLEALLSVVCDGMAATAEAQRMLKNRDTQGRKFMVALVHTRDDLMRSERRERK